MTNDLLQATINATRTQLIQTAARGWLPDDLRHVLPSGTGLDYLLHTTCEMLHFLPEAFTRLWREQSQRSSHPPRDLNLLRAWLIDLHRLAEIPGVESVLGSPEDELAGLDPAQRKAHQRIQGLLAKAESTTYEDEARALLEKAAQLRQRYRLAGVQEDLDNDRAPAIATARIHLSAPWIPHQAQLLNSIADPNGCRAILFHKKGLALLIGEASDVRHVVDTFASVNRQREWFMRHSPGARAAAKRKETNAYRRSFQLSYAAQIGRLMWDAVNEATAAHSGASADPGHGLPALNRREVAVSEAFRAMFPHTTEMSLSSRHAGGYSDGVDAANNSKLGPDTEAGVGGRRALAR